MASMQRKFSLNWAMTNNAKPDSERQYKRKILHWGLDKNIKESDMKYVLQKQLKRKLESGKDTESTINGRLVPPQKMQRFTQRKGISNNDILMYQTGEHSLQNLFREIMMCLFLL